MNNEICDRLCDSCDNKYNFYTCIFNDDVQHEYLSSGWVCPNCNRVNDLKIKQCVCKK